MSLQSEKPERWQNEEWGPHIPRWGQGPHTAHSRAPHLITRTAHSTWQSSSHNTRQSSSPHYKASHSTWQSSSPHYKDLTQHIAELLNLTTRPPLDTNYSPREAHQVLLWKTIISFHHQQITITLSSRLKCWKTSTKKNTTYRLLMIKD